MTYWILHDWHFTYAMLLSIQTDMQGIYYLVLQMKKQAQRTCEV